MHGFYIVKEEFFARFQDPCLMDNKGENRPHYFAFVDRETCLSWMIPISSRVEKYEAIIRSRENKGKPCDILHICTIANGKKVVFLIQDMFPIDPTYVAHKYTINNNHLILMNDKECSIIESKARRMFSMIHRGVKIGIKQPDVLKIEKSLSMPRAV